MWEKVKNWIIAAMGAILAFLALLLGFRKRKIDKLETEGKVKDVIIEQKEASQEAERDHAEKAAGIAASSSEKLEGVKDGSVSYNDMVRDWNEKR